MRLITYTLAQRPDLGRAAWRSLDNGWPAFMNLAPMGALRSGVPAFAEHVLLGVAKKRPDVVIARAASVPFQQPRKPDGAPFELPSYGCDEVIRWAAAGQLSGEKPDMVASIEVVVRPDLRRRGLGEQMITAMKDNARRLGFSTLVSPVRPTAKHSEPDMPMSKYIHQIRADGLPADPWLRAHARLGARMVGVAPASTVIALSLEAWRQATGITFDQSGSTVVPDALVPVHVSVEHGYGVYVEPAVWMRHEL
jgi:GNAT superfamily N-acetyltransferase